MIKDEMKNKISMALKDPILQQGFEIICKHLEERGKLIDEATHNYNAIIADYEKHFKKDIAEKDKQIAELKKDMAAAIPLLEKAECTSCIYTDSPCVRGDYPMKDGHCTHHKHFGDEIADLKAQNEQLTLKPDVIKWHKVADGDLPKETGEYLTNIGMLIWDYYADGRYGWHTENCEFCDCCDNIDSDEVIAWCEIPQFKDKE